LAAIEAWQKHSPYEFNKVVNANGYKYEDGSEGIDGFQHMKFYLIILITLIKILKL
jgi:hypothetical protein